MSKGRKSWNRQRLRMQPMEAKEEALKRAQSASRNMPPPQKRPRKPDDTESDDESSPMSPEYSTTATRYEMEDEEYFPAPKRISKKRRDQQIAAQRARIEARLGTRSLPADPEYAITGRENFPAFTGRTQYKGRGTVTYPVHNGATHDDPQPPPGAQIDYDATHKAMKREMQKFGYWRDWMMQAKMARGVPAHETQMYAKPGSVTWYLGRQLNRGICRPVRKQVQTIYE